MSGLGARAFILYTPTLHILMLGREEEDCINLPEENKLFPQNTVREQHPPRLMLPSI